MHGRAVHRHHRSIAVSFSCLSFFSCCLVKATTSATAMDQEYSFQPHINSRSRRLARHAPTLRERQEQEQEERLRRTASRQRSLSPGRQLRSPAATSKRDRGASDRRVCVDDNDAARSVWALWRAAAAGEGRDEEKVFMTADGTAEDAARPRPLVVHVSTILAMLGSLGVRPPQHTALIAKFLLAVGAEQDETADQVVEAERFAYVFTTVWKAAVTDHSSLSRPATDNSPQSDASFAPSTSYEASPCARASSSSSRSDAKADEMSSDNGSFLHTNLSRVSTPPTPREECEQACTKPSQLSPLPAGEPPGLSLSPEPRSPHVSHHHHHDRGRCSPFSTTSPTPTLVRTARASSSTRVLASDSHLLTSTTSHELKKATKRIPGGLMRECTFKPKINDTSPEVRRSSAKAAGADVLTTARCTETPRFATAVRRMIAARQQQQQQQRQRGQEPKREVGVASQQPLLYVDVDLPRGETGRIALFRGADVAKVAAEFSELKKLDDALRRRLEHVLREQLLAFS